MVEDVVEDDELLWAALPKALKANHPTSKTAADGQTGLNAFCDYDRRYALTMFHFADESG